MIRWLTVCLTALGLVLFAAGCGCNKGKPSCEKLIELGCTQVEKRRDGVELCDLLKEQTAAVEDDECAETLRLLKDSGKLKTTPAQ